MIGVSAKMRFNMLIFSRFGRAERPIENRVCWHLACPRVLSKVL